MGQDFLDTQYAALFLPKIQNKLPSYWYANCLKETWLQNSRGKVKINFFRRAGEKQKEKVMSEILNLVTGANPERLRTKVADPGRDEPDPTFMKNPGLDLTVKKKT